MPLKENLNKFKLFLYFVTVETLKPIKTKSYLTKYVNFCHEIREKRSNNNFHYYQWAEIAMLIGPLNYSYIYFNHFEGDDIVINFDLACYSGFDNNFNLIASSFCCWIVFLFHKTYFSIEPYIFVGLKSLLQNDPKALFHKPYIYKKQHSIEFLTKFIFLVLNGSYIFCLFGSKTLFI